MYYENLRLRIVCVVCDIYVVLGLHVNTMSCVIDTCTFPEKTLAFVPLTTTKTIHAR